MNSVAEYKREYGQFLVKFLKPRRKNDRKRIEKIKFGRKKMGAWGTALYSDDDASDFRDEYITQLKITQSHEAAYAAAYEQYKKNYGEKFPDIEAIFWFVIAERQWRNEHLDAWKESKLLSKRLAVQSMAYNILHKYHDGVDFVNTEWKGDPALRLGNNFNAHSIHEQPSEAQTYECLSNEMRLSKDGFRQTTKGRSLRRHLPNIPARITPENSFSYSLPVLSRTVVNQVNYRYHILERVLDGDATKAITVRRRDCAINGNTITANVNLDRVWERIVGVRVTMNNNPPNENVTVLRNTTANILRIKFDANIGDNTEFSVLINP